MKSIVPQLPFTLPAMVDTQTYITLSPLCNFKEKDLRAVSLN
jgi:hypothetical protein